MTEIEHLKKLHKAQDTILSLRCRLAGLKGKCLGIIEYSERANTAGLYKPEEVKLAKEFESEIDQILNRNELDQILAWLWVQFLLYLIYWKWEIYEEILNQLHTGCPWRTG